MLLLPCMLHQLGDHTQKKKKKWWEQGSHTNWSIITETTGTSSFMKFASTKFNTGD